MSGLRNFIAWQFYKLYKITRPRDKDFSPSEKDVFFVSYPRSGNTWLRLVLANYIWNIPQIYNLGDLQNYVPDIYYKQNEIASKKILNQYRIIKSHEPYRSDYRRLIYLYRRPFDCAWSYYFFLKEWKGTYTDFEDFLDDFFKGNLTFGSWYDHLTNWHKLHHGANIFVCYENFIQTPLEHLKKIIIFLDLPYDHSKAEISLRAANPQFVSEITNDEQFYGKKFETFVKSPLGINSEKKEEMRLEYKKRFANWDQIYLEFMRRESV